MSTLNHIIIDQARQSVASSNGRHRCHSICIQ